MHPLLLLRDTEANTIDKIKKMIGINIFYANVDHQINVFMELLQTENSKLLKYYFFYNEIASTAG